MSKFMITYHAPAEAQAQNAAATPEQQQAGMQMWMDWAQRVGDKLTDMGSPLSTGTEIKADGSSAPSNKNFGGYSFIEAANLSEVKDLLKGHPHLAWHPEASIEIHEAMPIPGAM